jgi:hypothetical protein
MVFPAQLNSDEFDEEFTRDLLSSEPMMQQNDMWSGWTPFQTQYGTPPLSQPGETDLVGFVGWEDYLITGHTPASIPLQVANDTNSHTFAFQAPASDSTGWVHPNALPPRHGNAGQHTQLDSDRNLDNAIGQPLSTSTWHDPCLDAGWQPISFNGMQNSASLLVPHTSSTYSATTLTDHPKTINSASSGPSQVLQTSSITTTGPFDFAEIERQSLQSSDHQTWQLAPQTQGSSFYLPSLDAPPIPYLSDIGARSAHDGLSGSRSQMVLPTCSLESTMSVTHATDSVHPVIAPKPHVAEIAPATSSQSHALVSSTAVSRKSAARPNSKLTTKTISGPRRPIKHQKREKMGFESYPGYYEFPSRPHTTVKRHNIRYGKKRDASEKMTRENGACVLCRHQKKRVSRLS